MNSLKTDLSKYSVIIVTGGSSGIGKVFINNVINLNSSAEICNVSRSKPEEFLSHERFTHYSCDLGIDDEVDKVIHSLQEKIKNKASGEVLLINNSGFGSYGMFADLEIENELEMIDVNVKAVVKLTHGLLPAMRQRGGAVLNVASTAAWQATPYLSTYGATKAFLFHWGMSLNEELRGSGVNVLTLCPGPTESNFFKRAGFDQSPLKSNLGQTAQEVVETAFKALAKKKAFTVSGWANRFLVGFASKLPRAIQARVSGIVLKRMRLEKFKA